MADVETDQQETEKPSDLSCDFTRKGAEHWWPDSHEHRGCCR